MAARSLTVRTCAATHEKIETLLDAMTDHWSEQTNALGANVWPKTGWTRFDAHGRPLTMDQIREHARHHS